MKLTIYVAGAEPIAFDGCAQLRLQSGGKRWLLVQREAGLEVRLEGPQGETLIAQPQASNVLVLDGR